MIQTDLPIFLASKSPRRRKLLKLICSRFKSFTVDLDEELLDGEHPIRTVKRLALDKMRMALNKVDDGIVLTADTIVVLKMEIIGKPKDAKDAAKILKILSNNTHRVYTGFALTNKRTGQQIVDYAKTYVTFKKLSGKEIEDYIATGSPMDKAGAYGIQDDYGAVFIEKIVGCYYNIVGLPVSKIYNSFKKIL